MQHEPSVKGIETFLLGQLRAHASSFNVPLMSVLWLHHQTSRRNFNTGQNKYPKQQITFRVELWGNWSAKFRAVTKFND